MDSTHDVNRLYRRTLINDYFEASCIARQAREVGYNDETIWAMLFRAGQCHAYDKVNPKIKGLKQELAKAKEARNQATNSKLDSILEAIKGVGEPAESLAGNVTQEVEA